LRILQIAFFLFRDYGFVYIRNRKIIYKLSETNIRNGISLKINHKLLNILSQKIQLKLMRFYCLFTSSKLCMSNFLGFETVRCPGSSLNRMQLLVISRLMSANVERTSGSFQYVTSQSIVSFIVSRGNQLTINHRA